MIRWRIYKEETEEGAFKVGDRVQVADTYKGKPTTGGRFSYDPPSAGMTGTVVDTNRQRYHDFKSGSMGLGMGREKTRMWYIVRIDDSCRKGGFIPGEYGFDEKDLVKIGAVNEANEDVNIKKLLKQNGVTKFPSNMVFTKTTAEWEKRHGHAGKNTIRNMCIQLEHAGWKRGDWTTGGIPDGSAVANSEKYTSPDGKIVMSYYAYYGVTAYDNSYSITFKLAEDRVDESSRFGFEVGDKVVLTKDKSNRFSGDFIPAGTEGEIVAVDKPMPGVMKVKIEDWKTISVPERSLKFAGTDNEPWKKLKKSEEPKRDIRPERPEDYYMRPTSYGSPRYTGD